MSRPFAIALITAAVFAIMTLAIAEPVAIGGYVPIEVRGAPPATVVVVRGDHLWKISKATLGGQLQREPRNEEVHPYWLETIEINLDSLRSGDPDLIYPGEELVLPAANG
ncbi:MAG: LysM peptidoglycan-binding domain-containing protein [Acidimicrobiia bacterium]